MKGVRRRNGLDAEKLNDIYYQGNITKELPVDMKITYTLDGKTVSPEELAGQSGQVTIRFDYTNRQKEKVETNGICIGYFRYSDCFCDG